MLATLFLIIAANTKSTQTKYYFSIAQIPAGTGEGHGPDFIGDTWLVVGSRNGWDVIGPVCARLICPMLCFVGQCRACSGYCSIGDAGLVGHPGRLITVHQAFTKLAGALFMKRG